MTEKSDREAPWNHITAVELRHALRTPLNHIIGYGEMLLEQMDEAEVAGKQTGASSLRSVAANARDVVEFIQNALGSASDHCGATEMQDFQAGLLSRAQKLSIEVDQ